MPKLTPEGRRVLVFQHFKETSDDFEPNFMLKRLSMIMDILLQEGYDYIGIEIIVDSKYVCTGHLARYNLSILKRSIEMGWVSNNGLHIRLRSINSGKSGFNSTI